MWVGGRDGRGEIKRNSGGESKRETETDLSYQRLHTLRKDEQQRSEITSGPYKVLWELHRIEQRLTGRIRKIQKRTIKLLLFIEFVSRRCYEQGVDSVRASAVPELVQMCRHHRGKSDKSSRRIYFY